jgi:hypothetical protein
MRLRATPAALPARRPTGSVEDEIERKRPRHLGGAPLERWRKRAMIE